jgi:hypothetical protein
MYFEAAFHSPLLDQGLHKVDRGFGVQHKSHKHGSRRLHRSMLSARPTSISYIGKAPNVGKPHCPVTLQHKCRGNLIHKFLIGSSICSIYIIPSSVKKELDKVWGVGYAYIAPVEAQRQLGKGTLADDVPKKKRFTNHYLNTFCVQTSRHLYWNGIGYARCLHTDFHISHEESFVAEIPEALSSGLSALLPRSYLESLRAMCHCSAIKSSPAHFHSFHRAGILDVAPVLCYLSQVTKLNVHDFTSPL